MAQNPFDQFDAVQGGGNPFDRFENTPTPTVAPARYPDDIKRGMANLARPVLEYGGMMGGSLAAGGPLTPSGIAGAGLGYAGGNLAANYLDEKMGIRQPPDMLGRVQQTGQAATEGALMEMGGGIAGNLLQRGGTAIANSGLPEWLYSKAMRTPMTEAWKRTIPTKDWTQREKMLETGWARETKPNALGKQDVVGQIRDIETRTRTITDDLTKANLAQNDTSISELVKALDPLKYRASMARDTSVAKGAIGSMEESLVAKGGVRQTLNPSQLSTLKKEFYKDIDFDMTKKVINENGRFTTDATKAIAQKAMERLEELAPELAYLNKKEGSLILLQKAIEHTLARYENTNAVGLGAKMMSVRNIGMAALDVVTGTPSFKAGLAFALKKAGKKVPDVVGRPLMIYGNQDEN